MTPNVKRITLLDGSEVEIEVGEGEDLGQIISSMEMARDQQRIQARQEEHAAFAQRINTTPMEASTATRPSYTIGMSDFLRESQDSQEAPSRQLLMQNAAAGGTDTTTGLPENIRGVAKTAGGHDELRQLAVMEYLLNKEYKEMGVEMPEGIPLLFTEPYTGETAYLRPEQGEDGEWTFRPTLVNPPGLDPGDVLAAGPLAMQIGLEASGSVIGAALGVSIGMGGGVPVMTIGAALGSGTMSIVSNKIRQAIARQFEVPEEYVQRIEDDDMLHDALWAAGADTAFGVGYGMYRAFQNTFRRPLEATPEQLAKIRQEIVDNIDKFENFNDVLDLVGNERIMPTLSMVTSDTQMIVMEGHMRSSARDWVAKKILQQDIHNRLTFGSATRRIGEKHWPTAEFNYSPDTLGGRASHILREPQEAVLARQAAMEDNVLRAFDGLPTPSSRTWLNVQDLSQTRAQQWRDAEQVAWTRFKGEDGINIDPKTGRSDIWLRNAPTSPIRKFLAQVDKERMEALAPVYREAQEHFLRSLGVEPGTREALEAGLPSLMDDALDLRQVHILMSYLKASAHKMENAIPGWTREQVSDFVKKMERQINRSPLVYEFDFRSMRGVEGVPDGIATPTGAHKVGPERAREIRKRFWEANDATRNAYAFEDLAALTEAAKVRRIPGGARGEVEFVNQPDTVRSVFLQANNSNALAELKYLYGTAPELKVGMQQELLSKYRETVLMDGKFSKTASDRFLSQHFRHIELLFGKEGAPEIRHIQHMAQAARRYEVRAADIHNALESFYGRKLTGNNYAGQVAKDVMSGNYTGEQVSRLASRIRRADPEMWADIQKQGLNWINDVVTSGGQFGKDVKWGGLNRLLSAENIPKLDALYGPQYARDLGVFKEALEQMHGPSMARGYPTNVQTPMLQIGRSLMGPLSKKQRFLTAANRGLNALGVRQFRELMLDPTTLRNFVKLADATPGTYGAAHIAMRLPNDLLLAVDEETRNMARRLQQLQQQGGFSPGFQVITDAYDSDPTEDHDDEASFAH